MRLNWVSRLHKAIAAKQQEQKKILGQQGMVKRGFVLKFPAEP